MAPTKTSEWLHAHCQRAPLPPPTRPPSLSSLPLLLSLRQPALLWAKSYDSHFDLSAQAVVPCKSGWFTFRIRRCGLR